MMTRIAIDILEGMFLVGIVGSAVVVVWTAVDDLRELALHREPHTAIQESSQDRARA